MTAPATGAPAVAPGGPAGAGEPQRMPLGSHLREARTRLVRSAVVLAVGLVAGYGLSAAVLDLLRAPVEQLATTTSASLNYDSVTAAFDLRLKIALYTGIALAAPVWVYEILAYVLPGLTRRERRLTLGFLGSGVVLFVAGAAVGVATFPHMVTTLAGFASEQDSTILQASQYVGFVLTFVLATGTAFVVPVLVVLLNVLGVLPAHVVTRSWRAVVVVIVLFSAMVTPSADILSMVVVAVPMSALFLAAMQVTRVHDRRADRRALDRTSPSPEVTSCSA